MKTRTMKVYTAEFKQEAVQLVTDQGMSRARVARDLGVSVDTLARWIRAATPLPAVAEGAPSSTAADLARLRRENEQLRLERDILKKALGIFSQMPH